MRWLRRCWHVTSRTFHDDDVYHDDGYDDDVDGGGAGPGHLLMENLNLGLLFEKSSTISFSINLVDNWTGV